MDNIPQAFIRFKGIGELLNSPEDNQDIWLRLDHIVGVEAHVKFAHDESLEMCVIAMSTGKTYQVMSAEPFFEAMNEISKTGWAVKSFSTTGKNGLTDWF